MTPAQAYGHPNFVTDVPVQGPTDEGLRAADCWYSQNRIPARPACVDCEGPIPMWTRNKGLLGEHVSFGGVGVSGFALAKAGDPDIWEKLTGAQQSWLATVKEKLNSLIVKTTGTKCTTWGPTATSTGSIRCFQEWYNSYGMDQLRTDGVLDRDTLDGLIEVARLHASDGYPAFPGTPPGTPSTPAIKAASTDEEKKGLSTGAMVGIGAGVAAAVGGIIYAATRGKARRRG